MTLEGPYFATEETEVQSMPLASYAAEGHTVQAHVVLSLASHLSPSAFSLKLLHRIPPKYCQRKDTKEIIPLKEETQ